MSHRSADQVLSPSLGETNPSDKVRAASKSILHWVLYLFFMFLFVEVSLQLFYRITTGTYLYVREKPPIFASDPSSGWTNRPNFSYRHVTPEFEADIYINGEGFRVSSAREEYEKKTSDDTYRVLLLGPSFAFGWGVSYEDTFGAQLQQMLRARYFAGGAKIEVMNHGVAGLPAANELEWFKRVGSGYKPDLVIHLVYGSLEARSEPKTNIAVHNGVLVLTELTTRETILAYAKHFATVFYGGVLAGKLYALASSRVSPNHIEGAGREMRNSVSFSVQDPVVGESLVFYERLREAVASAGAELLLVYFPLGYVIYPEDRARWAILGVKDIEGQIEFNRAFASYLNKMGVKTLNLTEPFLEQARSEQTRLYYWLDTHWTERGNLLAARIAADELTRQCAQCVKLH